jgi:hypothetical protein
MGVGVFLAGSALATTVVGIWTPKAVLLAADSMAVETINDEGGQRPSVDCKILATTDCAVGFSGLVSQSDTKFDAESIGLEACRSQGDVVQRATYFEMRVREPLMAALVHMRRTKPKWYAETYRGKNALGALFVGKTTEGKLIIVGKNFRLTPTDTLQPVQTEVLPKPDAWILPMGEQTEISEYVKSHHDDWIQPDLTTAAARFIQMEIDAVPEWVGPPITVFVVENTGPGYWASGYAGRCNK